MSDGEPDFTAVDDPLTATHRCNTPPAGGAIDADSFVVELRRELDRTRLDRQHLLEQLGGSTTTRTLAGEAARGALHRMRNGMYLAARLLRRTSDTHPSPPSVPVEPYAVRRLHASVSDPRPRVLHVIANFHTGGSSRLVVDLEEHLGHRFEQHVVAFDLPPTPAYVGLPVTHLTAASPAHVDELLDAHGPALIHVHYLMRMEELTVGRSDYDDRLWHWYRAFFGAAERRGVPVIENVNIPTAPYVNDAVRCYVHVSDYVRARYGRLDGRHVTIYPGSDLNLFRRTPRPPVAADCLGMVYRLEGDKLDEHAIEPFIEAVRRRPGTRALIVGGGRFLEAYRTRVAAVGLSDAFTFTGYVPFDALPALLERMSVFVAPVHTESFGQVSPFAMGMELPVVGYRVGALGEITGDPTLLAPPGDAVRLAEIAVALLDDVDRRARVGAVNRARAEQLFSVESMIARYEALYDELTAAVGSRSP